MNVRLVPVRAVAGDLAAVRVRAIRSSDVEGLRQFYAGLDPESRRARFLSISAGLSHAQSVSFCTTDHEHQEGFVAVAAHAPGGHGRIVGHLCIEPDGADAAEVAIAVAEEFQHRGIGRRLMAAGVAWARSQHMTRFTATMLGGNAAIQRLLLSLGLPARQSYAGAGVSEMTIDLAAKHVAA